VLPYHRPLFPVFSTYTLEVRAKRRKTHACPPNRRPGLCCPVTRTGEPSVWPSHLAHLRFSPPAVKSLRQEIVRVSRRLEHLISPLFVLGSTIPVTCPSFPPTSHRGPCSRSESGPHIVHSGLVVGHSPLCCPHPHARWDRAATAIMSWTWQSPSNSPLGLSVGLRHEDRPRSHLAPCPLARFVRCLTDCRRGRITTRGGVVVCPTSGCHRKGANPQSSTSPDTQCAPRRRIKALTISLAIVTRRRRKLGISS
jgi:hypothetical protein